MRPRGRSEHGQVLVIVAMGMIAIVAMVGLVIDGGYAWSRQRDNQNGADAVAKAGTIVVQHYLSGLDTPTPNDFDVACAVEAAAAQNGTTVAFTVLIPGQIGLRFHSVWVTDALAPAPVQADTSGLRRVNALEWTTNGLAVSGTRRTQENGAAFQIAVVERLGAEKSQQINADRSSATPIASPAASPISATPKD